jgi:hypothetical protein
VESGGKEGEGSYFAREIENAGGGGGAGGGGARAQGGAGPRCGPSRLPYTRSRLLLIKIHPRIEN